MQNNKSTVKKGHINIERVNKLAGKDVLGFIQKEEKRYHDRVKFVAKKIASDDEVSVVFVSGPSASGKTTTSFFLKRALAEYGREAVVISLDNFFLDGDKRLLDENGKENFELPQNIDIELFKSVFDTLIIKRRAYFPKYDFKKRKRTDNAFEISINKKGIVIVEGIHALNPLLHDDIIIKNCAKVYVCANRNFSFDGKKIVSANTLRLVRRMIRDSFERNLTFENTISLWHNVNVGTEKFVKPYKKNAQFVIDTVHCYELMLYKNIAGQQMNELQKNKEIAKVLLSFKKLNGEISAEALPFTSLLNEFCGRNFE